MCRRGLACAVGFLAERLICHTEMSCLPFYYLINKHSVVSSAFEFRKIVAEREIAHNEQFLLLPAMFSTLLNNYTVLIIKDLFLLLV